MYTFTLACYFVWISTINMKNDCALESPRNSHIQNKHKTVTLPLKKKREVENVFTIFITYISTFICT